MGKTILTRMIICIGAFSIFMYSYIDCQNELTRMRLKIPQVAQEIRNLKEENTRLKYEIDLFESPHNLMRLASSSEYSHLKHSMRKEILTVSQGIALQVPQEEKEGVVSQLKPTLAV